MPQHATARFKDIREHNGEVLLRVTTTLSHIVGTTCSALYSFIIRGLRELTNIQTINGVCNIIKYVYMY